jgi:hypothetical protein
MVVDIFPVTSEQFRGVKEKNNKTVNGWPGIRTRISAASSFL